jgi:hypothetical protein
MSKSAIRLLPIAFRLLVLGACTRQRMQPHGWAVRPLVQPSFMSWPCGVGLRPGLGRLLPGKRLVSSHAAFDSVSLSLARIRAPGWLADA